MIKQFSKIKDTVKEILLNQPETRDDDFLLILKVWAEQNGELRNAEYPFIKFAADFLKKEYAHFESIRRMRAKLQEEHQELRGNLYYKRRDIGGQTSMNWKEV